MARARPGFMRRLARKYYETIVEIVANGEMYDDQGQPTVTPTHKAWSRCKIDIFTAFANANVVRPGGAGAEPLTSVTQLFAMFPLDEDDHNLIAATTESGDYVPGGIDLEPMDTIKAFNTLYEIHGIRGPHTQEISRHVDLTIVGDAD